MYCSFNHVDADSTITQSWNFFHLQLNFRSYRKQNAEVDYKLLCDVRLLLTAGLATGLQDPRCPEFPASSLAIKAER